MAKGTGTLVAGQAGTPPPQRVPPPSLTEKGRPARELQTCKLSHIPKCTRCHNHNVLSYLKGHKCFCCQWDCQYTNCLLVMETYHIMATQVALCRQQATKVQAKYAIQYENIFFLCRVLEQLLERETRQENAASSICDEEEKKKFLQNLDQAIFHLSDEFPLFCVYLWRLGTLLNAAETQTGGERNWPASE